MESKVQVWTLQSEVPVNRATEEEMGDAEAEGVGKEEEEAMEKTEEDWRRMARGRDGIRRSQARAAESIEPEKSADVPDQSRHMTASECASKTATRE